jgi:hypothetical protein
MCFSHYDLNAALQGACIETMARHLALPGDGAIIVRLSFAAQQSQRAEIDDALAAGFENRPLPI